MALPIPAPNSQAVNTGGGVPSFISVWWNWFNSLITGVIDGSNASAGQVGEYLHTFVLAGAAVNLPNNTNVQIASLALTAGDWDLWGEIYFPPTAATIKVAVGIINTAVAIPVTPADGVDIEIMQGISATDTISLNGMRTRVSITSPTTYLLVGQVNFTGTSVAGYGGLRARRMR